MKLRFCENVEILIDEEGAFLENKDSKEQFRASGAGVDFLEMIDGQKTLDDIIETMLEIYGGVEPYVLVKDMERFAHELIASRLIEAYRDEQ